MRVWTIVIHRVDGHIERVIPDEGRAPISVVDSGGSLIRVEGIEAATEGDALTVARGVRLSLVNRGRAPHTHVTA